jgi:hypothetical protein
MHLADLLPDADLVLALEPEELGRHILMVLDSWPAHQALQLSTFINTTLGHPQTPGAGPYPTNRRGDLQEALSTAWAWLEGQALLIADNRYGEGVVKVSPSGRKIARPEAPALPDQRVSIPTSAAPSEQRAELFTLRPGIWGVSIDLKEVGRRVSSRWQQWRGKHR